MKPYIQAQKLQTDRNGPGSFCVEMLINQNDYMEYALFLDDNNYFDAVKNLNDKSNSAEIRENAANIALRVNQLQNGISDKYGVRCYLSFSYS